MSSNEFVAPSIETPNFGSSFEGSAFDPSIETSNSAAPAFQTSNGTASKFDSSFDGTTPSSFDSTARSSSNGTAPSSLENAKNVAITNASAAAEAVKNHPITQNVVNHPITQNVVNGPVAENIKDQHAKTTNEFSNLAASRTTPAQPAATGQQLTHYHSFFSTLLSWENPRASGIAFVSTVLFIFAARYFDILRYGFKLTWMTLGVTLAAEVLGKAILGTGLSSQIRPKKYLTIPKSTLDNLTGDLHELINFFVIESQRIVFAENVFTSLAAFLGAFFSYFLIKIVPVWGLALISTTILFLTPLIYKTNQELIDHHINNASSVVNQQTTQVKQLASHHASRATDATKQYVGDASAKAQEIIGNARARSTSPVTSAKPAKVNLQQENTPAYKSEDFPVAPKQEFAAAPPVQVTASALRSDEPLISS